MTEQLCTDYIKKGIITMAQLKDTSIEGALSLIDPTGGGANSRYI